MCIMQSCYAHTPFTVYSLYILQSVFTVDHWVETSYLKCGTISCMCSCSEVCYNPSTPKIPVVYKSPTNLRTATMLLLIARGSWLGPSYHLLWVFDCHLHVFLHVSSSVGSGYTRPRYAFWAQRSLSTCLYAAQLRASTVPQHVW